MLTCYHASSEWFEQPDPAFIQSGKGHSTGGLGLYLTPNKNYAKEFIERKINNSLTHDANTNGGVIYVTNIDDSTIYDPYKKDPDAFQRILDSATIIMGEPICTDKIKQYQQEYKEIKYNAWFFMSIYIPDQQTQNNIYHQAGYTGNISVDPERSICLTDPKAFPTEWTLHSIIGNGPKNMPSCIKNIYTYKKTN